MKRPLLLPFAIALGLGASNALALGLGPVHVKSKLNQPLDAEIPVIQGTAGEAEGLLVSLAGADEFERVGINRSRLSVPLEFAVVKGANGQLVIKVTSKEIVRESYLDFLVEANWPKGRLLREYTVLLDPPLTAPARSVAAAPAPAAHATTAPLRETRSERPPAAAAVRPSPRPEPAPGPARKVVSGEYGPVEAGETLSAIARATRPGDGVNININQMMLALLKNNPDAFYKDNINALKRGAILRVPSADEIKATASANEAAAQVRAQIEDWRGGRAAAPTLVANAGAGPASEPAPAKAAKAGASAARSAERLELVPPKSGKDSVAVADRPGSGAGSDASAIKADLARTREALATRDQEAGELKSRVKELEDLKGKNDRLISLKDSEIAELQQKLKQLQAASNTAAAKVAPGMAPAATPAPAKAGTSTTPATTAATGPGAGIDKQDIRGKAEPALPAGPTAPGAKVPPAAAEVAPTTPPATAPAPAAKSSTPPAASGAASSAPVATSIPLASTPPSTVATNPAAAAGMSARNRTPGAQAPAARTRPEAPTAAWYESPWLKIAALAAGVLLLLRGLFGLRKRKAVLATGRGSIADAFGDSPLAPSDGAMPAGGTDEEELREQLSLDPGNVGLHLELLGLFYANRDVARFEEEAAEMHAHVVDPHQPEWLEAQAMGQELAPHNPLFAGAAHFDDADAMNATAHADTRERPAFDDEAAQAGDDGVHAAYEPEHAETGSAFDAHPDEPHLPPPPPPEVPAPAFDFDDLPPLEPHTAGMAHMQEPEPLAHADEDYFASEDAIGTKLDLAKAYMDMGDPEGARSMLEEVVAEGSDTQKAEAHRLMAELG